MQNNPVDITVIMPSLNEEKNVGLAIINTLQAFKDHGLRGEIIVVNDGSNDKTRELVEDIVKKHSQVSLLNHSSVRGIGASYWDGVDMAKGDVVTWIPGDNENDPWEIFRYYKLLEHVDIIIPFIFNKEARALFRNGLSFIYRFIINTTFRVNFNYTNGTILFRKVLLQELQHRSFGFFFQTDILIRTVKKGYLFAEVPYRLGMRKSGTSKAVTFPSLWRVVKGYSRLVKDCCFAKASETDAAYAVGSQTEKRRT